MATSTSSRSICSRSERSAAAARPSTAVWPSLSPNRIASPEVINAISAGVSSPASCRATAATSCSNADPYSARTAAHGCLRAHRVEQPARRAFPAVGHVGAVADVAERHHHQDVPEPPGQVPVRAQRHRDHRLGEQHVGRQHRQQDDRATTAVEQEAPQRRKQVERHRQRDEHQRPAGSLAGPEAGIGERRQTGERHDPPQRGEAEDAPPQRRGSAQHPRSARAVEVQRRRGAEQRAESARPAGRGEGEPAVGVVEQHTGRGQGVQPEEQRGGEEAEARRAVAARRRGGGRPGRPPAPATR